MITNNYPSIPVNENGKLLARIGQHVYSEATGPDGKPATKIRTDVEIPSKGIHKSVVQQLQDGDQALTENGNRRSAANLADIPMDTQNIVSENRHYPNWTQSHNCFKINKIIQFVYCLLRQLNITY